MNRQSATPIDQRVKLWNKLTVTPASFQVESIKFIESNLFAQQTITLDRIIALVGMHGSGKSLLLRVLEASFGYTTPVYSPPFLSPRYGTKEQTLEGVVEVSLRTRSGSIIRRVNLTDPPETRAQIWKSIFGEAFMAWYVDPVSAFMELHVESDSTNFIAHAKASQSGKVLTRAELDALNNILGRQYDHVTVRVVRDEEEIELPFISAKRGSQVFDNIIMSQGELWVHYVNWFLDDEQNKGHLALIDEPETFLAASGRRPFIDHIARSAMRTDRQVIVGTHSPEMLSRFPLANIRLCVPVDSGTKIVIPRSLVQVHDCIGTQSPIRGLALVEDELAKQLLSTIFARYDTALTREVEIIPAGGASEVISGIQILQKAERLACFPILDADQRATQPNQRKKLPPDILFLPGVGSPEAQLLENATENADWLADMIGIKADQISIAISSSQHLDHQYHLGRVAEHLGFREETLTGFFIQAWLRRRDISEAAEELAREVRHGLIELSP